MILVPTPFLKGIRCEACLRIPGISFRPMYCKICTPPSCADRGQLYKVSCQRERERERERGSCLMSRLSILIRKGYYTRWTGEPVEPFFFIVLHAISWSLCLVVLQFFRTWKRSKLFGWRDSFFFFFWIACREALFSAVCAICCTTRATYIYSHGVNLVHRLPPPPSFWKAYRIVLLFLLLIGGRKYWGLLPKRVLDNLSCIFYIAQSIACPTPPQNPSMLSMICEELQSHRTALIIFKFTRSSNQNGP